MSLSVGFKYLGFFKIDSYKVVDWQWLLKKYEQRICHWCNHFLTLGGRYVLIKVVLESQPVYWLALAHIPGSVLNQIRMMTFSFLWSEQNSSSYHLCKWETLARPKSFGGWGIRNIFVSHEP
jgi:hypothetical protein